jgi:hypothetical protein
MHFLSFLILLILSAFAAAVLHWVIRYRFFTWIEGFLAKWIITWIAAWLGPTVLGHWFGPVMLWNIYIIPALIASFIGAFGVTACCRVRAKTHSQKEILESPALPSTV